MTSGRKGKLIVLEGADGSGKSTQIHLLAERLKKEGLPLKTLAFPQYGKKSAGLVEEYLAGKYGKKPEDVNPYAASLFFALDRFDASPQLKEWLGEGHIVLLDRYVDSNAGHQGAKIKNLRKRRTFLKWLYDIEYNLLEIPKPDLVIILHTQRLFSNSAKERDIHERDALYLARVQDAYLWLANEYPKNHRVIRVGAKTRAKTPREVHQEVWQHIWKRR